MKFFVQESGDEYSALLIEAYDADEAVKKWAEQLDAQDDRQSIARTGNPYIVFVWPKDSPSQKESKKVWGEFAPVYYSCPN